MSVSEHAQPRISQRLLVPHVLLWCGASFVLLQLVSHNPLIAYGNNYDFIRLEACSGVWLTANKLDETLNSFVFDGRLDSSHCMPSIDMIFSRLVAFYSSLGSAIDIRVIGEMRAWLLIGVVSAMILGTLGRPASRLIALILSAALIDIAIISYFNTFYSEYSVIAGILLLLAACLVAVDGQTPRVAFYGGIIGGVLLVFSKEQYTILGSLYLIILAVLLFRGNRLIERPAILVALALFGPLLFGALSNRTESELGRNTNFANKIDTYMGAILPHARDIDGALQILGLPNSCRTDVGKTWYMPDAKVAQHCPQVLDVPRVRLLPLFLTQPSTFAGPLADILPLTQGWYLDYAGRFENGQKPKGLSYWLSSRLSISRLVARMPLTVYVVFVLSCIGSGLGAFAVLVLAAVKRIRATLDEALVAIAFGGMTAFYALVSTVFGDGYWEAAKHAVALDIGCMIFVMALTFYIMGSCEKSLIFSRLYKNIQYICNFTRSNNIKYKI